VRDDYRLALGAFPMIASTVVGLVQMVRIILVGALRPVCAQEMAPERVCAISYSSDIERSSIALSAKVISAYDFTGGGIFWHI
jgi:hypothetical protein